MKVQRALLSVHDKAGVVDLARALAGFGVEILSTGGTARLLRESGVTVRRRHVPRCYVDGDRRQ